jgi:transcriptional regulator with XRE-family HTH domain
METTQGEGLRRYQIGAKLRALRLRRKLGLVSLGKQTDLSAAMLSKIERGRLFPTLPTLFRIASVFGVGLDYFFGGLESGPMIAVVRKAEREALTERRDGRSGPIYVEPFEFCVPDRKLAASYVEVEASAGDAADRHSHPSVEFVFVLNGTLNVSFDLEERTLEAGDAMYFDATHPHGYARRGPERCHALIVTTS